MIIGFVVFLAGAVLMATEVVAFRVIGRTFGSALRETSAVIAVFLAAMSAGYAAGGALGDRRPKASSIAAVLVFSSIWLLALPWFHLTVGDAVAASSLPLSTHALAATAVLFFLPVASLAAVSPIGIRLAVHDVAHAGRIAGGVSAASAMGSIAGTLATGFWLLGVFSVSGIIRGLAAVLAGTAVVTMLTMRSRGRPDRSREASARHLGAAPVAFVCLATWLASLAHATGIVHTVDTAYHHIRVEDDGPYRILHFDDTNQSRMLRSDPAEGGYEYTTFFHMARLFTTPRRVAFLGLGGGTGPKQFLREYPDAEIVAAEVDPGVVRVAREYFALPEDPRLEIEVVDGRVFLRRSRKKFDAIIVDAYTSGKYGSSIPFQMTTREFFELCKKRLAEGGVVLYNVIERPGTARFDFLRALYKTIGVVFPERYIFTCETSDNSVVLATTGESPIGEAELFERAKRLLEEGSVKRPDFLDSVAGLDTTPFAVEGSTILTDDYAPIDQLLSR